LCLISESIDKELIDAAGPSLRVISTMSVGLDHIDVKYCREKDIVIGHTPNVLTNAVADLYVTLLLTTMRRIPEALTATKNGQVIIIKIFSLSFIFFSFFFRLFFASKNVNFLFIS